MEQLHLLAVALGLATLAGLNLYLTVFVTGLAVHYHWITLMPPYQSLEVLGQPVVIIIAGVLFAIEFLADKIPWIDSAWDAVHTIIRPIGGALLAVQVLGNHSPTLTVVGALLAGGTALISHTAKAATRLASNASPEPFSNIALSFGEDIAVVGGLALIYHNPLIALAVFAVAIAAVLYFAPKLLRLIKAKCYLAWKKLYVPAFNRTPDNLPLAMPQRLAEVFGHQQVVNGTTAWVVPCISGRGRRVPANLFGALVAMNEEPRKLLFVARKSGRAFTQLIDLEGAQVVHEPKFLSENLNITSVNGKGPKYFFVFPRSQAGVVAQMLDYLRERIEHRAPVGVEARFEPAATAPV